jgi:hypothetical protein
VEVVDVVTGAKATTKADDDGSFALLISAMVGHQLEITATDAVLNRGPATTVTVIRKRDSGGVPLAGLKLWVKADAEDGVVKDASGLVSEWRDQAPDGTNHLTQATGTAKPTWVANGVNGRPTLHFDGGDVMQFATRLTNVRTVFWVIREDGGVSNEYRFLLHDSSTTDFHGGYPRYIWYTNASPSILNGQTWLNAAPINGTTTERPRTMSVLSVVTTGPVNADRFGSGNGPGRYWVGDLAELIIYDRPLSGIDQKAVEDYLALKYALYGPTAGGHSAARPPSPSPPRRRVRRSTTRPTAASRRSPPPPTRVRSR